MAENLAYKPETGNYWAYENMDSNIAIYGYLYDWETAMNIAPEGWHLPSLDEWNILYKSLGAKHNLWPDLIKMYPKLVVGGSSGLNMLLGGMRTCDGEFRFLGDKTRFWTSTTSHPFHYQDSTITEKTVYGLDKDAGLFKVSSVFFNRQSRGSCPG